jgi:coenzyme Q-binding protein COQ10
VTHDPRQDPFNLGPMPPSARMIAVDRRLVAADADTIFTLAREVERWPELLPHYRHVRFISRTTDGGGVVDMAAVRPFGPVDWPTWWVSEMQLHHDDAGPPWIRYRHVRGITRRMEVLWAFKADAGGTMTTVLHMWNGPSWPVIGELAARRVIGPVFVHGIASRTLAGLARVAERSDGSSARSGA